MAPETIQAMDVLYFAGEGWWQCSRIKPHIN